VLGQAEDTPAERGEMPVRISITRQRVPMVDFATLEDRTRPPLEYEGSIAPRLRYFQWPTWSTELDGRSTRARRPTKPSTSKQARMGRR